MGERLIREDIAFWRRGAVYPQWFPELRAMEMRALATLQPEDRYPIANLYPLQQTRGEMIPELVISEGIPLMLFL